MLGRKNPADPASTTRPHSRLPAALRGVHVRGAGDPYRRVGGMRVRGTPARWRASLRRCGSAWWTDLQERLASPLPR
jgi:hypothetical protein